MKSHLLLAFALLAVAGSAVAQDPAAGARPASSEPAQARPDTDHDASQDLSPAERHCLRHTGTRTRVRNDDSGARRCGPGIGRVWTRRDLESTGQPDIAHALRMLDVSIR